MSNEDIKMSDVFELPVQSGADGCVYDLHYSRICTSGSNSKEITHAINNHDPMALRIKELESALLDAKGFAELIQIMGTTDCEIYKHELKGDSYLAITRIDKALEQSK